MQNLTPTPRPVLDFEPVPRKYRYDGWTAERQRAFIAALAETGSVRAAAKRINMSPEGAYHLRRQPGADGFRAAWAAALAHGVQNLVDIAIDRAIEGVAEPVYWRGEQVGERRRYNDRLLMFNIRHHLPDAAGLNPGTRSRATIEREAAENCPVCRARAAAAVASVTAAPLALPAPAPDADDLRKRTEAVNELLKQYAAKVGYERRARLRGEVAAADFTVRQLTYIEVLLGAAGASAECLALWQDVVNRVFDGTLPEEQKTAATDIFRLLDEVRWQVWDREGGLRPDSEPSDADAPITSPTGEDAGARIVAQHQARKQMAKAQALWEAAATEEGWKAWSGTDGDHQSQPSPS